MQSGTGATAQTMMEVGPYFASTPYVAGATFTDLGMMTADSAGNAVSASSSGTVTLKIERPERLPLPGETPSTGVMDMSALNYWVSISNTTATGPSANCPPAAYSSISGATLAGQPDAFGAYLLVDNTSQDFDPAAANPGPIEVTVNLSACEATGGSGYVWTPGTRYQVLVSARGAVGDDRANLTFSVFAPPQ